MKRTISALLAGAAISVATVSVASAAPANDNAKVPSGTACQQAGIGTLQSLGLLSAVAKNGIEVAGVGVVPFRDVLKLHRSNPALFQTGGVSVVVPGLGTVPATWCNGV